MPNWCSNVVTFTHKDEAKIQRVIEACKTGLFNAFMPCPPSLRDTIAGWSGDPEKQAENERKEKENLANHGHRNWYDWQCAMWGTKWDVYNNEKRQDIDIEYLGPTERAKSPIAEPAYQVWLRFETAWSPPISFYEHMADAEGFHINAYYYEPGVGFCGHVEGDDNGLLDNFFDLPSTAAGVDNEIPAAIDRAFNIAENMRMWEEEARQDEKDAEDAAAANPEQS